MRTVRIKISGLVQGVFFRKYIKEQAEKLFEALDENDAVNNVYSNLKN